MEDCFEVLSLPWVFGVEQINQLQTARIIEHNGDHNRDPHTLEQNDWSMNFLADWKNKHGTHDI